MDGLSFGRDVSRDCFLALGEDFAQRPKVSILAGFLE
jgi:hypothetical protein